MCVLVCAARRQQRGAAYTAVPGLACTATIDPKLALINQHPSPHQALPLYCLSARYARLIPNYILYEVKIIYAENNKGANYELLKCLATMYWPHATNSTAINIIFELVCGSIKT